MIKRIAEGSETFEGLNGAAAIGAIDPGSLYIVRNESNSFPVILNARKHCGKPRALLDSGATENFLSPTMVKEFGFKLEKLPNPKRPTMNEH
jgi:hypothetical protein